MAFCDDFYWYKKKKNIQRKNRVFFNEREIWWCYLGLNIGDEQNGGKNFSRPVVILKKFNKNLTIVVPLTKNNKKGKYYFYLNKIDKTAIISQIRPIDVKRLHSKIGFLGKGEFKELKNRFISLFI